LAIDCLICRTSRAGGAPNCRRYSRDNDEVNAYVARGIALDRVGLPDDIGGAVAAILSDDMGWANGTTSDISGGQLL
jgi:NAD(P)-dependent dehydrogenase (short-subunit alcohol dehydrogenase family)